MSIFFASFVKNMALSKCQFPESGFQNPAGMGSAHTHYNCCAQHPTGWSLESGIWILKNYFINDEIVIAVLRADILPSTVRSAAASYLGRRSSKSSFALSLS